jgi:hypothetical protein
MAMDKVRRPPSELLSRVTNRDLRSNDTPPVDGHFCGDPDAWGRGDESPFLGVLWP